VATAGNVDAVSRTFAEFAVRVEHAPVQDFAALEESVAPYCVVHPPDAATVCRILARAHASGTPVRLRGRGHSMNGSSLPRAGDLLLSTDRLLSLRFLRPGTIHAGAGVQLWTVRAIAARFDQRVPVVNHGYPAPSVGGYVASGGFGTASEVHGGFWNSVRAVTLVDPAGVPHEIRETDPAFTWVFGSMGQLGCVVEVELKVNGSPEEYPAGLVVTAEQIRAADTWSWTAERVEEARHRLLWFTLLTDDRHRRAARLLLEGLQAEFAARVVFRDPYEYVIAPGALVAPLFYDGVGPCIATGVWGLLHGDRRTRRDTAIRFERAFRAAAADGRYGRYVQSEFASDASSFALALQARYDELRNLRRRLDGADLLNRGAVFSDENADPD
jgi:hypothetical protein